MKSIKNMHYGSLFAVLLLAGSANADEQSVTQSQHVELSSKAANSLVVEPLTFKKFDPAEGKLTRVTMKVYYVTNGQWAVENLAPDERSATVGMDVEAVLIGGTNRVFWRDSREHAEIVGLKPYDGIDNCRGSSSANRSILAKEDAHLKFAGNDFWIFDQQELTVPLRLEVSTQMHMEDKMSACSELGVEMALEITYHYLPAKPESAEAQPELLGHGAPVHAWREDCESPIV